MNNLLKRLGDWWTKLPTFYKTMLIFAWSTFAGFAREYFQSGQFQWTWPCIKRFAATSACFVGMALFHWVMDSPQFSLLKMVVANSAPPPQQKTGDTMKFIAIFAVCLMAVSASAQTPTPTPSATPDCSQTAIDAGTAESNCGLHFIPGSAFYQLSNGKQATEFDARLPLTSRVSGFAAIFMIPGAQGNITIAGGEYREKLGHLLGKKVTATANLNLNKIEVFGRVGLGSEINSLNNARAFAFLAEVGVEFPLAQINNGPVISTGVRLGYVGVPHPGGVPEKFVLGSNVAISPQITLSF